MLARRILVTGAVAFALAATSCAYFNTLYNAQEKFDEAEKAQQAQMRGAGGVELAPGRSPQAAQYELVVEKCKKLMATYPDSKHVDDAMILTAKSLYRLGQYEEAVSALDTLETRYPKSGLLDDAAFWKGKSLVAAEQYDIAAPELKAYVDKYKKHDGRPEGLYLLCISLMQLGLYDEAVTTLGRLEKDHGRSDYRFKAQVDMAAVLSEKELYKESLAIYQRMSESRIPETVRFDVLMGMASVQEQLGDHTAALATLRRIRTIPPGADNEPQLLLLRGRAFAGVDSTRKSIGVYKDVTRRFARGTYAAEAYFRLGELYEGMDSLPAAQTNYQETPRAYSGSEFADEAIKRSSNISRVLRLQQTSGDDSPEAIAMRTFSMAEIQFFQFNNTEKAIPSYEKIVTDYPDSEFAPRAAYALGYINGVVLGDSVKARAWYDVLLSKYPDSPQTQFAYAFYKGATPPPPYSDLLRTATVVKAGAPVTNQRKPVTRPVPPPVPVDTTRTQTPPAPADTSRTQTPADTSSTQTPPPQDPPPAPADTTAAPSDSSRGGN